MTEPTDAEQPSAAMSTSRSNSRQSIKSTATSHYSRQPQRFAAPPAERKPAVRIEDLYPHAYWLEKYNRMHAARSTTPLMADFSHQWCAGHRPLTWKFYSTADADAIERYACGEEAKQRTNGYLHVLSKGEVEDFNAKSEAFEWSLSSHVKTIQTLLVMANSVKLCHESYGSRKTAAIMERFDVKGHRVADYRVPLRRASLSDHVEQLTINRETERPPFAGVSFKC